MMQTFVNLYFLQALDQCKKTLSELGLVRISAEDAAGAAQVMDKACMDLTLI